jgi:hypothetical protein
VRSGLGRIFCQLHVMPFIIKDFPKEIPNAKFIIHHQYVGHVVPIANAQN